MVEVHQYVRRRPASMDQKADGPTEDLVQCRTDCGVILVRLAEPTLVPRSPPVAPLFVRRPSSVVVIQSFENTHARPSLTEIFLTSIDDMSVRERGFCVSSSPSYRWIIHDDNRPQEMRSPSFNGFDLVFDRLLDTRDGATFVIVNLPIGESIVQQQQDTRAKVFVLSQVSIRIFR
jgi:hypothetical protein